MSDLYQRIFSIVAHVPCGCVVTYGQVAMALGMPQGARAVGWAMRHCPDGLPWHRVINSRGQVSLPGPGGALQRALLEDEGVLFHQDKVDLVRYQWDIKVRYDKPDAE